MRTPSDDCGADEAHEIQFSQTELDQKESLVPLSPSPAKDDTKVDIDYLKVEEVDEAPASFARKSTIPPSAFTKNYQQ